MKIRNTGGEGEKIAPQMAPMIDVVFQLLIFFMLTLKIIAPEGDFNINMPIGQPTEQQTDLQFPDIKVHLVANETGGLENILLGRHKLGNDHQAFDRLNSQILQILGGRPGSPLAKDIEVEIKADYGLYYEYMIQAIGACTGRRGPDGQVIRYIEKINFTPPERPGGA